jgi:hypothetical protein
MKIDWTVKQIDFMEKFSAFTQKKHLKIILQI